IQDIITGSVSEHSVVRGIFEFERASTLSFSHGFACNDTGRAGSKCGCTNQAVSKEVSSFH
ncbi:MAG: hypothetical protein ACKOCH_13905, partial [Bacteroidota bacterium]